MSKKDEALVAQKKPVGDDWTPCIKLPVVVHVRQQRPGETHVSTREGITPVKPDDLIMRGVSGEEYPIDRVIFEQTYSLDTSPQPAQQQEPVAERHERRVEAHNNVYATEVTVDRLLFLARQGLHSEGDTVGWYEAYFAIDRLFELAKPPAQQEPVAYRHKWDKSGERCVKCGDKDWMGGTCTAPDTTPPAQPAQQEPVAGLRCKIIETCKSCQHSVGRLSCSLAGRDFDSPERSSTPPEWCPLPIYTPPPASKPLPKGEWPKHPSPYVDDQYIGYTKSNLDDYATQVLAAHGITGEQK